jgi:hypothetical protein
MADFLTIDLKYEYCQHEEAVQKQGNKFPFSVALEYCKKVARSMREENCNDIGADVAFMFDKKIAVVLNKMMIERFRSKAQRILEAFLVKIYPELACAPFVGFQFTRSPDF